MEREAAAHPGGMASITGCTEDELQRVLAFGREHGALVLAAHNAPDEWTVSGDAHAISAVLARHAGSRLPVSGAWHSPAMAGAVDELRAAVAAIAWRAPAAPVIANRSGDAVADADAGAIAELLAGQLVRPIRWARSMATARAAGVTDYVVLGPSKVIRALVHKNLGRDTRVHVVETLDDVTRTAKELRS
jgi:[acyl-carrier-protein] S-malonyltransferase